MKRSRGSVCAMAFLMAAIGSFYYEPAIGRAQVDENGSATAHRSGGKPQVSNKERLPKALLYRTGFPGAEPTLGIGKDGVVFTNSWEPSTQVDVLRSSDGGRTWERVSPRLPGGEDSHRLSFDPYIYLDEDGGRLFTVDLLIACSYLSFSDDLGDTWTTNPLACGQPFNDHQTLFSGPPVTSSTVGYSEIVYYCFADYMGGGSFCSKSLDGGISFLPAGERAFPSEVEGRNCGGLHGHGVADDRGTIYLPAEHCGRPFLAISKDEGATWRRVQVSRLRHEEGPDPAVAVDKRGNLYYVWIGRDRLPYLTISRDGGDKWSNPVMIAAPGIKEAAHVTVAVGDLGKLAFGYMGSENSRFARCAGRKRCRPSYAGIKWNGYIGVTANALSPDPLFFSAAVNANNDPLVDGRCGPRRCDWLLDYMDVAIGPDGTPWATFVDTVGGEGPDYHEAVLGRLVGGPPLL
ncbi:MAG: sialidase family protein [Actinomycetota bacterium]